MLTSVLTPRIPRLIPRLTISRNGVLARTTALSWPWNKDRILATPSTLPPTFTDLALGLVDRTRPVIQVWCQDPLQRENAPVVAAQARAQGVTTPSATDHGEDVVSAQNPLQRERPPQLPLRPPKGQCMGGEGQGEVGRPQNCEPHLSAATTPAQDPVHRERTGPLRNGNPRGNPNLAPRCGARTRRTGCPCRAPAMRNGRCRLHGGKSTGPRTEEGRARIRAARTRHGLYSAESRAFQRDISFLLRSNRELLSLASQSGPVDAEALRHLLPPEFGKHLLQRENTPMPRPPKLQPGGQDLLQPETTAQLRVPGHGQMANPPSSTRLPGPATTPSAPAVRRPILLSRPTVHATQPGKHPMQREPTPRIADLSDACHVFPLSILRPLR